MSRHSYAVRARSRRLAVHLRPLTSSLLGTRWARSYSSCQLRRSLIHSNARTDSPVIPPAAPATSATGRHQLPSLTHRRHAAATSTRPGHTPLPRHVRRHTQQPTATSHPPAKHAHSQSSSTQRRSQSRPLISPPAVRRAGLLALRRLLATPQPPRTEPLREPTPQPLPVGPPPPYPDRAAIPRQLVTPPAVADPIPLRRAR